MVDRASSWRGVALLVVAALAAACGHGSDQPSTSSTPPDVLTTAPSPVGAAGELQVTSSTAAAGSGIRIAPLTPRDPNRIDDDDRAAIAALGDSGAADPSDAHGHTHGASTFMPLLTGDAAVFANQWLAARRATAEFDTIAEIEAMGYVRSSAPIAGIGSHWVSWPQIARPFDPARPAMVLFDESLQPAELVGFSYWLQSASMPEGFAGPNDHWHQHQGLCVVNGWVDRERATGPDVCAGTYLAGGDLWMLHAWPVDRYPNRDGPFATVNPMLCPGSGVPDIARCADE